MSTIWIQVPCFVQWSCKVVLGVQLRGLGVALVGFHIPWGPATWPWCGLGWISHSLGSSYVALVWPWLDFTFPMSNKFSTSFITGYNADAVNGINDSG